MSLTITVSPGKVRRTLESLGRITASDKVLAGELTTSEIAQIMALYPAWRVNEDVAVDTLRRFADQLYRCVQAHTTQADWTPPEVPALWVAVAAAGVIPEWSQPAGGHDAYRIGDEVTHNGNLWLSHHDSNVWEPGTVGAEIWEDMGPA